MNDLPEVFSSVKYAAGTDKSLRYHVILNRSPGGVRIETFRTLSEIRKIIKDDVENPFFDTPKTEIHKIFDKKNKLCVEYDISVSVRFKPASQSSEEKKDDEG